MSVPQEIPIPSNVIRRCFQLHIIDDAILERQELFYFDVMFMNERSLQSMGIKAMDLNGSVIIDNDDGECVSIHSNISYVCSSVCICMHVYTYIYTVHTTIFTYIQYAHVLFAYIKYTICSSLS